MTFSPADTKSVHSFRPAYARLAIRYRIFALPIILLALAATFYTGTSMTRISISALDNPGRIAAVRSVPGTASAFDHSEDDKGSTTKSVTSSTPAQPADFPIAESKREVGRQPRDTIVTEARPRAAAGRQRAKGTSNRAQPTSRWLRSALKLRQQKDEQSVWSACMADGKADQPFGLADFLAARPPRLQLEAVTQSSRRRSPGAVTLMVSANLDRLGQLTGLCASWSGVISAAVYVPTLATQPAAEAAETVAAALRAVQAVHRKAEGAAAKGCQLDVLLLSEKLEPGDAQRLFPVNAVRNFALLAARTELVLFADADLLAGASMNKVLSTPSGYDEISTLARSNKLVVVPAFETEDLALAYEVAAAGKEAAKATWAGNKITQFYPDYDPIHGDTDFPRWMNAKAPYDIPDPNEKFEPWYIASRARLAPWDVRYRGYGKNKVQQLHSQLSGVRSKYVVHHRAFMIHRPHAPSTAQKQFRSELRQSLRRRKGSKANSTTDALGVNIFSATKHWFEQQRSDAHYRVLVAPAWQRCQHQLPWWQIYGQFGEPMGTVTNIEAPSVKSAK